MIKFILLTVEILRILNRLMDTMKHKEWIQNFHLKLIYLIMESFSCKVY